jgi:hypothetical protein
MPRVELRAQLSQAARKSVAALGDIEPEGRVRIFGIELIRLRKVGLRVCDRAFGERRYSAIEEGAGVFRD